jgi:hypothetical protein
MTATSAVPSAAHRAEAARALTEAGFDPATIEALLAFDAEHFLYVRRVMKGDIPQSLMRELDAGIEISQFHALSAWGFWPRNCASTPRAPVASPPIWSSAAW